MLYILLLQFIIIFLIMIENGKKIKEVINHDMKIYYINLLKQAQKITPDIMTAINDLSKEFVKNLDDIKITEIEKEIEYSLKYLENYNKYQKYEKSFNKTKNIFKKYNELLSNIYNNNYLKKIKELNENLSNIFLNIVDSHFSPPLINDFNNSSINLSKYSDFYQDFSQKTEKEDISISCSVCNKNEALSFCGICNQIFCKDCLSEVLKEKKNNTQKHEHKFIYINEIKSKAKKSKILFLKSIKSIIKNILLNSNYILNKEKENENIKLITTDDNTINNSLKISYIKRKYDYPYIFNFNDFDSQIEFLKQLNFIINSNSNQNQLNNSFHISSINKELIFSIQNIFIDEKINLLKEALSHIDNEFYSDEDDFEDECYVVDKLAKSKKEFEEKKNQFFYSVDLFPWGNSFFNKLKIEEGFIEETNYFLSIKKENIYVSFNNKCNFIDNFIRTEKFFEMSLQEIVYLYPNLNELLDFKKINTSLFAIHFGLENYLDYKGNFILPNKNFNKRRGTEIYDPPYEWIGIGLKVIGKYDDDEWLTARDESSEWAIAYHGLGRMNSFKQIKTILKNVIIKEGLIPGPSQVKCHHNDLRHSGKKIGTGIYMTQSINIAEQYSGIISFNNKKYKIVLMARVLIDKIREPEDINYWILNKEYIRVYRILLKEKL